MHEIFATGRKSTTNQFIEYNISFRTKYLNHGNIVKIIVDLNDGAFGDKYSARSGT